MIGKLFTRTFNIRLIMWAENIQVYIEVKAGFMSNMGTTDKISFFNDLITHLINQRKRLFGTFMDFSYAFDFGNKDNLWYKLITYSSEIL